MLERIHLALAVFPWIHAIFGLARLLDTQARSGSFSTRAPSLWPFFLLQDLRYEFVFIVFGTEIAASARLARAQVYLRDEFGTGLLINGWEKVGRGDLFGREAFPCSCVSGAFGTTVGHGLLPGSTRAIFIFEQLIGTHCYRPL